MELIRTQVQILPKMDQQDPLTNNIIPEQKIPTNKITTGIAKNYLSVLGRKMEEQREKQLGEKEKQQEVSASWVADRRRDSRLL